LCSVSLHSYVLCFLVVLVKLSVYLPSDWLERLLRKPIRGKEKPRPKSIYDFFGLVYLSPALQDISDISRITVARYSLFVLRVPLNAVNQPTLQPCDPPKHPHIFGTRADLGGRAPRRCQTLCSMTLEQHSAGVHCNKNAINGIKVCLSFSHGLKYF